MPSTSELSAPEMTGGLLVMFEPGRKAKDIDDFVRDKVGSRAVHTRDFHHSNAAMVEAFDAEGAVSLDNLGIALVRGRENLPSGASLAAAPGVVAVRPEFWLHAIDDWSSRLRAWLHQGQTLLEEIEQTPENPSSLVGPLPSAIASEAAATWGLAATKADKARYSGSGIRIAILDTGLDRSHGDFVGRSIIGESFVPDEEVDDRQGHGTHCVGTACGPRQPTAQIRYGIAHDAQIYVGKVLSNAGSGRESWVLAGIDWAVGRGCEIISMSLGRPVQPNEPPDPFYERAGSYALENGSLIVAAAGNESWRQYNAIRPVGSPANASTIMAVGAVDAKMKIANFSCGSINPSGGEVDIVGPGVDILSSFLTPRAYERLSGTSMATPHVAGIAALYAESDPSLRGKALWQALQSTAVDVGLPKRDCGAGLVIAPM